MCLCACAQSVSAGQQSSSSLCEGEVDRTLALAGNTSSSSLASEQLESLSATSLPEAGVSGDWHLAVDSLSSSMDSSTSAHLHASASGRVPSRAAPADPSHGPHSEEEEDEEEGEGRLTGIF